MGDAGLVGDVEGGAGGRSRILRTIDACISMIVEYHARVTLHLYRKGCKARPEIVRASA